MMDRRRDNVDNNNAGSADAAVSTARSSWETSEDDHSQRSHPSMVVVATPGEICENVEEAVDEPTWRKQLGQRVVQLQTAMDDNFSLVRVGCLVVMAGSVYASLRFSGIFQRFDHVDAIPSQYFRQRKKLRVRMIRQHDQDPNVFYVYHTPFWRRVLLQDTTPRDICPKQGRPPLLAVRAFGVQVDESAEAWVWANAVSSRRYMTVQLLHRMPPQIPGDDALATCHISLQRFPWRKDFAYEMVSHGLAECIPESLEKFTDGPSWIFKPLVQRLKQLEAAQKHAQTMQYGIWKGWQDETLSKRVVAASKRVTTKGFQMLMNKVTGGEKE